MRKVVHPEDKPSATFSIRNGGPKFGSQMLASDFHKPV
jgi:hypothetical protein